MWCSSKGEHLSTKVEILGSNPSATKLKRKRISRGCSSTANYLRKAPGCSRPWKKTVLSDSCSQSRACCGLALHTQHPQRDGESSKSHACRQDCLRQTRVLWVAWAAPGDILSNILLFPALPSPIGFTDEQWRTRWGPASGPEPTGPRGFSSQPCDTSQSFPALLPP